MYRDADWETRKRKVQSAPNVDLPLVGVPLLDLPSSKASTGVQEGPAGSSDRGSDVEAEPEITIVPAQAFPLYDNLFVLVPQRDQRDEEDDKALIQNANRDNVDPFDLPERDRMYALATQFVANHVRVVRPGKEIKSTDRVFGEGTLVVSERQIPRIPLRIARISWAIGGNRVVDTRGHRVPRWRLSKVTIPARRFIWAPGKGDSFDLAYLLANLCAILNMRVPIPIAAVGDVGLEVNHILGDKWMIEERRQALLDSRILHMILPVKAGYMPGNHLGVDYWPVHDVNEAAFSLFAAAASETVLPDLKHRWRVKMAMSWISLVAALSAFCAAQLDGSYLGNTGFRSILTGAALKWTGAVVLTLFAICVYATHRYNRMDR